MKLVIVGDPPVEIRWFVLAGDAYQEAGASPLLGVTAEHLVRGIDWPG